MTGMHANRKLVGFVVDGLLPSLSVESMRRLGPRSIYLGGRSQTAMGVMRFGWIADAVNRGAYDGLSYELYRPLRRYDMLIFVKSMGPDCIRLAHEYRARGKPVLFDINVNYFETQGVWYYESMKTTPHAQEKAIAMARECNGVMAASLAIEEAARRHNSLTTWIPDNVNLDLVPASSTGGRPGRRLRLLWSGQTAKLFDLLTVEEVLRASKNDVDLVLITNDLSGLELVYEPYRSRLKKLLEDLECKIIRYESIPQLLRVYGAGGVIISPRFLDSSYNRGHTEWKVTLGMACGCVAVCSPQESYVEVARRSAGAGIRVCRDAAGWTAVLDEMLGGSFSWDSEQAAARHVVATHYSTAVVAEQHARFVKSLLDVEAA